MIRVARVGKITYNDYVPLVGEWAVDVRMYVNAIFRTDLLYQLKRSQLTPSSW